MTFLFENAASLAANIEPDLGPRQVRVVAPYPLGTTTGRHRATAEGYTIKSGTGFTVFWFDSKYPDGLP